MTGAGKDTLVKGKRSCTVLFFSAYFIYYAVYCVFSSFIVLFLTEQGYSATVCGIITSLTFLANLLMEPVGGYITDTFLPTRRYLLVCIGIVSMVCLHKIHEPVMAASAGAGSGSRIGLSL